MVLFSGTHFLGKARTFWTWSSFRRRSICGPKWRAQPSVKEIVVHIFFAGGSILMITTRAHPGLAWSLQKSFQNATACPFTFQSAT
jgi:hypothetical protein